MRKIILVAALFVGACSHKDMTGRTLNASEEAALKTCKSWLRNGFGGTIGTLNSEEAIFVPNGTKQIDVVWSATTKAGKGIISCSTDETGIILKGGEIDGIQVKP